MQKLQDSVFSIVKTTNLSPAVFSYLQPTEDFTDKTPQGGILSDTKHGWLALGPKFCVVDLRSGLKVAARTFGTALSNFRTTVTSVVELPTPLTDNSQQLIISLECEDIAGMICVFHINGSQILRCIQTEVVVTELAVCNAMPDGPFECFDGVIMAGTKSGEIFIFDLNRASLVQALKDILEGYEHMIRSEINAASLTFLSLNAVQQIEAQRELTLENEDHIAVLLNENSLVEGQYIFRNPDGSVRMKAKRDHIRVTVVQYIPQLGSLAVGFNFGAFQIWNIRNLELEFTSQVNVECLPVTHFGFQEPCDDPRAFCYLWVVFSVIDRFDEEEFPLAVMYSLTYQGKRMISDTKCLYQDFLTATVRFQVELSTTEENSQLIGGRCLSCHSYSVNSTLGGGGEDSMLNIYQLVWECWGENANSSSQYGMLLFDLDQWYKDQMPATYQLQSNAFMSATCCTELARGECVTLDVRLSPASVRAYSAATRLEEHFYPNSLHYDCICLNTSEALVLSTIGIQRQIINSMDEIGPTALLNPTRLYNACVATGLSPLYLDSSRTASQEEQRRYLLSVALEARLSRFLQRCAHDWATGSHGGAGCTLPFLVDWCWKRAIELKENAKDLTAPLFTSSALPDRNVVRCLEHCVQQLTQLTGLLDAVLTKCCNLVVPDALSEMEEHYKGIGTVSLYFQVVQWFLRCGLLPERSDACDALPYPGAHLANIYSKRRLKLHRLKDHVQADENAAKKPCSMLYIDQLIEQEFGGDRINQMWIRGGSDCHGLYPPPSLYSLLRLYLLPDIPEEHKHSLVLYLLVDYSMVYDEIRYEEVIRRLMQFPTMFGLSNTAIKATQAFWHLDHRDFDFALNQLQCLTGNNLSEWQHNVVLSSLLVQKKTQAALQYLHVRKRPPIQSICKDDMNNSNNRVNDHDKLEDWQSCCNLYLARGLVFEALDVIRVCVQNAGCLEDKTQVLNLFYKGCRNTGQLSKILEVTLLPFEEEVFIRYLESCNESQTSDILIMYFLQQARYFEAEQYNSKLKHSKPRTKDLSTSLESLADVMDREVARDTLVEVACFSVPAIANTVARYAFERDVETHIFAPKPMSVYVQAKSPKNTFTYKSSFIQDTIENASETWVNKPKTRRGLKRALNVEETPFICTPKQARTVSMFATDQISESTPPKRSRLDLSGTPRTPKQGSAYKAKISRQMEALLDMPEVHSVDAKMYERSGADTPHSILKIRRMQGIEREAPSPVDSRYLEDSDDEIMDTASNHTHYSDSTNKHLRFTIPTTPESGSTPSPPAAGADSQPTLSETERERSAAGKEKEIDMSMESYATTESHAMTEPHHLESPPKKLATEELVKSRKPYKDSVRARLSISANSSLSEDLNNSIESISDIPVTLINPRYSGERRRSYAERETESKDTDNAREGQSEVIEIDDSIVLVSVTSTDKPKTPKKRKGIRSVSRESTPLMSRSRSVTPERLDSPVVTPLRTSRLSRSRSRTPEISPRSSPLDPILEQPKQEVESEPHAMRKLLSAPRQLRSRSSTPEPTLGKVRDSPRLEAITESPAKSDSPISSPTRRSLRSRSSTPEPTLVKVRDSPRLEAITESPAKSDSPMSSPTRRSLRSRSSTPEPIGKAKDSPRLEAITESPAKSDSPMSSPSRRSLRSRSRTPEVEITEQTSSQPSPRSRAIIPEKLMSPKKDSKSSKKSLSRIVLEANAVKTIKKLDKTIPGTDNREESESVVECTPVKALKIVPNLMDVTISPIVGKSVLQSSNDSFLSESLDKEIKVPEDSTIDDGLKSLPAFTMDETRFGKSVLNSYESSIAETSINQEDNQEKAEESSVADLNSLPAFTLSETYFEKSVLHSYQSSVAETSATETENVIEDVKETDGSQLKSSEGSTTLNITGFGKSVLGSCESSMADSLPVSTANKEIKTKEQDGSPSKSVLRDVSSLMTSDSEIETREDPEDQWKEKDSPDTASNIKETVKKIDELQSEIDELKSDISVCDENEDDDDSEEEDSEDMGVGTDENSDTTEESLPSDESEVICIDDSESEIAPEELDIDEDETYNKHIGMQTEGKVIEVNIKGDKTHGKEVEDNMAPIGSNDPLNEARLSLLTDDNSVMDLDDSHLNLNELIDVDIDEDKMRVDDPIKEGCNKKGPTETEVQPQIVPVCMTTAANIKAKQILMSTDESPADDAIPEAIPSAHKIIDVVDATTVKKTIKVDETTIEQETKGKQPKRSKTSELEENTEANVKPVIVEKPVPRSRKRAKSTSSNKSSKDKDEGVENHEERTEDLKTPIMRKRSQSTKSYKSSTDISVEDSKSCRNFSSMEQNNPEKVQHGFDMSSSRRSKTPTKEERVILTRRVSQQLSGKMDDSQALLGELTPRRRSTRSNSRNADDNASAASENSVKSVKSKTNEDAADLKLQRKGRKSVLPTKPDLSVIPEQAAEESGTREAASDDIIKEYSKSRRLTRNQKAVLKSWFDPKSSPRGRRTSTASVASSQQSNEDDDASSTNSAVFDVKPIDRISLLNKEDFEGSPDPSEMQSSNASPESIASDASKQRPSREQRAVSESKLTPKLKRAMRRISSIDIGEACAHGAPVAGAVGSPSRGRRTSFTRACAALLTPKGRRASTDQRGDTDSLKSSPESEASATPSRRRARPPSAHSNTSQSRAKYTTRPKKSSTVDSKDTKK